MKPEDAYQAILGSITTARNTARSKHFNSEPIASDRLLDEMARNSAQAIVSQLEAQGETARETIRDLCHKLTDVGKLVEPWDRTVTQAIDLVVNSVCKEYGL